MSAKTPKENFKFSDVLAVAYASQRYNKKYIRETSGYAGYEGMEVKPIQIANKQIMRFALSQNNNGIIPQAIDILKRANIQVTEEHVRQSWNQHQGQKNNRPFG